MKFCLTVVFLLSLLTGTAPQFDGFDLSDALDDAPTPKPKEEPKAPATPKSGGFNLEDAFGPDPTQKPAKPQPKPPQKTGGTGNFGDSDLEDVSKGDYKPDGGRSGGRAADSYDQGGADQPQAEAGSGPIAGIISAVGVALVGAASSYFAYQKKKLCFKLQGGADPESGKGHQGTQSDPQVLSNLLRINQQA